MGGLRDGAFRNGGAGQHKMVERSPCLTFVCRGSGLNEASTVTLPVPTALAIGMLQTVTFALGLQDVAAVDEAVEGYSCQPLPPQYRSPVSNSKLVVTTMLLRS